MVGALRLVLAAAVALAHADVPLFGYHLGVPAVVVFYLLAGYVVALQWDGLARDRSRLQSAAVFYLDRALRLFPAYFAALLLAACIVLLVRPESYFLADGPNLGCAVGNLLVVPMNFFQLNGLDRCALIPVAWSLGLELQFYLLVPLLLGRPVLLLGLGLASMVLYGLAGLGIIATDMWGYRLLPATLFIFLTGVSLGMSVTAGRSVVAGVVPWVISGLAIAWGVAVYLSPQQQTDFAFETALGLALATPLLALALRFPRSAVDDMMGRIAYPLFLVHWPLLWLLQATAMPVKTLPGLAAYLLLAVLTASAVALVIDAPLARLRRHIRASPARG